MPRRSFNTVYQVFNSWYTVPNVVLTYAAPVSRVVVVHERSVVDHVLSCTAEAAAKIDRRVLCARNCVEYDRAFGIPSEHLYDRFNHCHWIILLQTF